MLQLALDPNFSSLRTSQFFPNSPSSHRMLPLVRTHLGVVPAVGLSLGLFISQFDSLPSPRKTYTCALAAGYLGHLAKGTLSF